MGGWFSHNRMLFSYFNLCKFNLNFSQMCMMNKFGYLYSIFGVIEDINHVPNILRGLFIPVKTV